VLSVYWMALFAATHVPHVPPPVPPHSDKWLHIAAFAVLAALFAWTWSLRAPFGWRQGLAVLVILAVYGAVDEVTQPYTGRYASVADWIADVIGIVCGLAAFVAGGRLFRRRA
jgi:VanZ family protein